MKLWTLLLPIPLVAAMAMVPQDPGGTETDAVAIATISDLQYISLQGTMTTVSARNVVEIRLLDEQQQHMRIELLYDNGDYSLLTVQGFHLLRTGSGAREVRMVRGRQARMRFPKLP